MEPPATCVLIPPLWPCREISVLFRFFLQSGNSDTSETFIQKERIFLARRCFLETSWTVCTYPELVFYGPTTQVLSLLLNRPTTFKRGISFWRQWWGRLILMMAWLLLFNSSGGIFGKTSNAWLSGIQTVHGRWSWGAMGTIEGSLFLLVGMHLLEKLFCMWRMFVCLRLLIAMMLCAESTNSLVLVRTCFTLIEMNFGSDALAGPK